MGIAPMEVLYGWSYENLLLLSRAAPSYAAGKDKDERPEWDPSKVADDPGNFTVRENSNIEDEEIIR